MSDSNEWDSLAPWKQAKEWATTSPELAERVMVQAETQFRHQREMEIRYFRLQAFGSIFSAVAFALLVVLAFRAAEAGLTVPLLSAAGAGTLLAASTGLSAASVARSIAANGKPALKKKGKRSR